MVNSKEVFEEFLFFLKKKIYDLQEKNILLESEIPNPYYMILERKK